MQAVMFKIWILPLVIPPAISFFSPCYLVVKRKVIPPATSFLTPYYLVVKREIRLVSSDQSGRYQVRHSNRHGRENIGEAAYL